MRDDFAVFIITHQRAKKQLTLNTLKQGGYSGRLYLVVDNMDGQLEEYKRLYGDMVLVFDKMKYAETADTHINSFKMSSALFTRNACVDLAREMRLNYYFVCDDDIRCVFIKDSRSGKLKTTKCTRITPVLLAMIRFMENTDIATLGIIYDGAYVGGINNTVKNGVKYEVVQFAVFRTNDPVVYESIMWEDTATICRDLGVGRLGFSPMFLSTNTPENGSNEGGVSEYYRDSADWINAQYVMMARPDCTKIAANRKGIPRLRVTEKALHPLILNERYKKDGVRM